jgi:hypothetical protein
LVWKLQQRKVGGPSHRIKTHRKSTHPKKRNRWHAMIRNDSSSKCWRHGPIASALMRGIHPLDVRHFEYYQRVNVSHKRTG